MKHKLFHIILILVMLFGLSAATIPDEDPQVAAPRGEVQSYVVVMALQPSVAY